MPEYAYEALGEGLFVCVSREHHFGTDAFLLNDFAHIKPRERVVDLGTGCGIIPMLIARDQTASEIYGVEIQPQGYEQCCLSIQKSGLAGRITPVLADLRKLKGVLPAAGFDVITMNPPYKAQGQGIVSQSASDQIARHETLCSLDDICKAAGYLLRFGGRLCICHRPERLCDIVCAMRANSLEPKRLRLVAQRAGQAPWLVLIEAAKGGRPFLKVLPELLVEDETGGYSAQMQRVYRKERTP